MTHRLVQSAVVVSLCFAMPSETIAALVYTSSTFQNFTVTQDDAFGFAAVADIHESGVKAGTLEASVAYGGGSNPFESGSVWGVGNFFRAIGQSVNTPNLSETADGDWSFKVTPDAGWEVTGLTLFTNGTIIANPVFESLTSNGTATVHDDLQGTADELFANYDEGDSFVNGDDLIFNPGGLTTGIPVDFHSRLWSYDSAGATDLSFTYSVGPVVNITNEGIAVDASLRQIVTVVPEPSALVLAGFMSLIPLRRRRKRQPLNR